MSNIRSKQELREGGVTLLGNQNTKYSDDYDPTVLQTFENKHPDNDYVVSFDAYEFTSHCIVGSTMIDVATDETSNPEGIPIEQLVGTEGYVYGVDPDTLEPVCRKYRDVRKTQSNVPVVRVVMDKITGPYNNRKHSIESIVCTPDHQFLVKRGFKDAEWVAANNLTSDMHLIGSQRSNDMIRNKFRHRLLGEALFGEDIEVIHHIDGNHYNNSPDNIENTDSHSHSSNHRKQQYGYDNILDVETLVDLYNSGENFSSIAKMYGCDESTIRSRIGNIVDKRSQSESLKLKNDKVNFERDKEICELYDKGYLVKEIAEYALLHETRVSEIIKNSGRTVKEANYARKLRSSVELPSLNHKVIKVVDAGTSDVYNMEVEDVHNFFANGVIVHNCPITGQPDFAKVVISYIPNKLMVESKSLKLYLFSFRNHGDFHEDCMNIVMKDLIKLMDPKYIEVRGVFAPRGGISIFPFANWANPDFDFADYAKQRKLDALRDASNRTARYDM